MKTAKEYAWEISDDAELFSALIEKFEEVMQAQREKCAEALRNIEPLKLTLLAGRLRIQAGDDAFSTSLSEPNLSVEDMKAIIETFNRCISIQSIETVLNAK